MEKNEIDPYRDYFEMMSSEREANMNRQGYKRMKSDFLQEQGMDPLLIDLDYAYDAGNEANTDILPAVSKKEDGSVTEDILMDTNTREGMAWAAASKELYDAFYGQEQTASNSMATDRQGRRNQFNSKRHYRDAPKTPQEFAQWGIEHIGWLNYNLPALGVASTRLPYIVKKKPKAAYAFLHLLNTYGKLPMFTWNGTKRFFNGVLKDPTTYVGLGTLGIGLAGKKFTTAAGKGGLKKALRAAIDPAAITMYEGALYAASDDFFRQKVAIEAGPEVEGGQESYDPVRGLTAAGGGALFGGALYGTAKVGANVAPLAIDAVKGVINKGAEDAKARIAERQSGTTLYSNPIGPIADEVISRIGGGDDGPPPGRNLDEFGFYSKAEEALNNIKQEKGTGRQFVNQLKNQFNVKEKELYWLGLDKFETDEKVDKKTLIDTVKQNYVKIRENKYSYKQSPTGDNADITDVNELQFQLESDDDYNYYSHISDDYHHEYEMGSLGDLVYDDLTNTLGYYTKKQVDLYEQGQTQAALQQGVFIPTTMTEAEIHDAKALDTAMGNGEFEFTDFEGDVVDFRHELNNFLDDLAREQYMQDPVLTGTDNIGLGYRIDYDPFDQSYQIFDPDGHELSTRAMTQNEAQVMATTDAYDQGHLLMTDPEEMDAIAGAVDQEPGDPAKDAGQPLWASHKLDGGSNYRELVLENTSFQGDPDADAITKEIQDVIDEYDFASQKNTEAKGMLEVFENLPESEKQEFLKTKTTSIATMQNDAVNAQLALNAAREKRNEVKAKYGLKGYSGVSDVTAALEMGPRTHYGSITNDIGHMRITDRRTNDGEKIMFVEEMQSDWSQKRAAMPTAENIERAVSGTEAQRLVDEDNKANRELLLGFLSGLDPAGINQATVKFFSDVKDELKMMLDNDPDLNRIITNRNRTVDEGTSSLPKIEQDRFSQIVDKLEINDFYDVLMDSSNIGMIMAALREETFDASQKADSIADQMKVALANAFVEKAKEERLIGESMFSSGLVRNTVQRNLRNAQQRLVPFVDAITNLAENQFTRNEAAQKTVAQNKKFFKARDRYGLVARGPFVQKSDDVVELQMKSLIRRAVEEDHKFIVVAGADVHIDRWGDSYTDAFNTHYGTVVPKAAEKVLKQFDKKAKVFYKEVEDISDELDKAVKEVYGVQMQERNKMLVIPISDQMRNSVKEGMSLFELGTLAGGGAAVMGSQMTQQENTEPGI